MIKNKTLVFIHQNFPGQFRHLCRDLATQNRIFFITKNTQKRLAKVELLTYQPHRATTPNIHPYLTTIEDGILHGQAVARVLLKMQKQGVRPDIIIGHSGWGETQFVKDIFPDVPLLSYFEFFYSAHGADVGFDPEYPSTEELKFQLRSRNQLLLSCLESTDHGISPTWWQQSRFPSVFSSKIAVIHDGVDTAALVPADDPSVTLANGLTFDGSVPLVTFVARHLEPYRGFHVFMRAAERILARHPTAHIVIVGGDSTSYGKKPPDGETYRARALKEVTIDEKRLHFVGWIEYDVFRKMLQVSDAHVYLTYPFVLSWSMIEAMSTGCLVIGSQTAPVEEVIRHEQNGLLVDFFDPESIASTVVEAISKPERYRAMRKAARRTAIDRYDLFGVSLPRQKALLKSMIG
ncbi:MAG TPA: glycosyltransferase [Aurantimonas coralicida]|uniref:Glycosyltransferase n=2 Tax=root TaxID=1 RepID=A0A9C9NCH7_9HYPH|nr:glycosyltransferase [Aurantimonas coralicida]HET99075.1 glycosyltransferase [Aurantimonas coralicida]